MGQIYKITNKINGKIYIGQTKYNISFRWKKHLSQINDSSYLHRSMKKYGAENFKIEVIEDCIDDSCLDDREKFWIKKLGSAFNDENGLKNYNLTLGGDSVAISNQKLSEEDVSAIKNRLKNTKEFYGNIAKEYEVSLSAISDINIGRAWFDENIEYPIRKTGFRETKYSDFLNIIEMLKSNLFSTVNIQEITGVNTVTIYNINYGIYTKYDYPSGLTFPIKDKKRVVSFNDNNKIKTDLLIILDFVNGETKENLSKKYSKKVSYIASITVNNKKQHLLDLKYPLKKYKPQNIRTINEKLSIINKIHSIYKV